MNNVRLYGFEECPYCQELKEFYENDNINFTYVDINLDENKEETKKIMEIGKSEMVPIVLVNKTILSPDNSFKTIKEALELTKKFLND